MFYDRPRRLEHPTPQRIKMCILKELWALPDCPIGVDMAVMRGIRAANAEHEAEERANEN